MNIKFKQKRSSISANLYLFNRSWAKLVILSLVCCTVILPIEARSFDSVRVSIKTSERSIEEILNLIEEQSGLHFIYNNTLVNVDQITKIKCNNESVDVVLDKLFKSTNIAYEIDNKQIILTPKNTSDNLIIGRTQQKRIITGVVSDIYGPVIGANVVIKGTNQGTITDIDGKYTIEDVLDDATLQISFIGYLPQYIKVGNNTIIDVTLVEDSQKLEEVVVVGYGSQKKENLTGAVAQVSGDVLRNRPITNVGQGLQGVIPNLQVTMDGGGAPGKGSKFNIRGANSINGGSPLILVDNVQMDPNLVNPEDIESISVLKDAASAAIYGARAAYGVILITTKKGKTEQKPQITLASSGYWQSPAVRMHNLNSLDYLQMRDIAASNSGMSSLIAPGQLEHVKAYLNGSYKYPEFFDQSQSQSKWIYNGNTDWFKELYKTSFSQQYNANISGGDSKTTYYGSLGFVNQNGILKITKDDYKKFNAALNLTSQVTKWLQIGGRISNNYSTENHPISNSTAGISAYGGLLKNDLSPLMPVRFGHTGRLVYMPGAAPIDDNQLGIMTSGDYIYQDEGKHYYAGQNSATNPAAVGNLGGYTKYKINDLWMTGTIKITPFEGLIINADYTFNIYNKNGQEVQRTFMDYTAVVGTEALYGWTKPSYANYISWEDYYNAFNVFAAYTKSFMDNTHNFKIMAGYNQEYKETKEFNSKRANLIVENIPDLDLATGQQATSSKNSLWSINGLFFRLNYNYRQRYLLEVNGRYDGSSKFSKGNRYAFFPSVSAAWRISEESFWSSISEWCNSLKIRGSYGSLGNQVMEDLGNFPYLATYGTNSSYNYLISGAKPVIVTAPGLVATNFTWETVTQANAGLDAAFLNNRLTSSFDWYRRDTKDMLVSGATLPATLGSGVPKTNSADMKTLGWEFSLGWNDRLKNGFAYWIKAVLSDNKSTITKYNGNEAGFFSLKDDDKKYYVGQNIGEIWGFHSSGLFQSDEAAEAANQSQLYAGKWGAGDVAYVDLDGDGKISKGDETIYNPGDRRIIGNKTPRYLFGVTVGFNLKNFDFEMFWQGVGKRNYMLEGSQFWGFTSQWDVPYTPALDYWTTDNRNAYFPRPGWQNGGNRQTSNRYLQSAAYGRLKNLTVGYTLPKTLITKIGLSRLRIYITGENLITVTPLNKAFDPETLGNLTYPINRKVAVGLNLTL